MPRNETPCPKCSGKMQEGFIYDQSDAIRLVSKWVEGVPEKSVWTGIKLKGRRTIQTQTFRCDKCGFLEILRQVSWRGRGRTHSCTARTLIIG